MTDFRFSMIAGKRMKFTLIRATGEFGFKREIKYMSMDILMVFLKPFVIGKVKTRLAKGIGDHQALEVYRRLVSHTYQEVQKLVLSGEVELCLCYSEEPDTRTRFPGSYQSIVQSGENL